MENFSGHRPTRAAGQAYGYRVGFRDVVELCSAWVRSMTEPINGVALFAMFNSLSEHTLQEF